ncbi:MAG: hypothetical protein HYU53_10230 [Acidobacteria bacterium]|nr:hypothetical protein [Acidobacteriota bacterium]
MADFASEITRVSFEGQIVEILEGAGGHCIAKIVPTAPVIVDLTGDRLTDPHLGDHVVVRGWIVGGHKEDV